MEEGWRRTVDGDAHGRGAGREGVLGMERLTARGAVGKVVGRKEGAVAMVVVDETSSVARGHAPRGEWGEDGGRKQK